jgi:hypothetical protein
VDEINDTIEINRMDGIALKHHWMGESKDLG